MYNREEYVKIMKSYVGAKQGDSKHKHIIDTYNSHKPLARNVKMSYTMPWCCATISSASIECGYTDIIPTECSCGKFIELMKKLNSWEERDDYVPSMGDLIIYDWSDNGKDDDYTGHDHIGVVEKVVNNTMTIIEGNYNGECKRRNIKVNARYIRGFATPKFDATESTLTNEECDEIYTVKKGDSLWKICDNKYNNPYLWSKLMAYNNLTSSTIFVGQKLKLFRKE